jgi:YjbE family integral membrane protein
VGFVAQYLNPALWLQTLGSDVGQAAFWVAVLQIIFINILLSGDNAVIIAMACRGLPPPQRLWGMVIGAGAAVLLRIVFGGIVAKLMLLPFLKLIGGTTLFYIAARLLVPEETDRSEVEAVAHLWRVAKIVVVADIVMSLDNIIAVAAAAGGDIVLLSIGLTISIPLIVAGAALIMGLLDRFPILVWAGAGLLGWIAGEVVATDPAVQGFLTRAFGAKLASDAEFAAAGAGLYLVIATGGLWRKLRQTKAQARTT